MSWKITQAKKLASISALRMMESSRSEFKLDESDLRKSLKSLMTHSQPASWLFAKGANTFRSAQPFQTNTSSSSGFRPASIENVSNGITVSFVHANVRAFSAVYPFFYEIIVVGWNTGTFVIFGFTLLCCHCLLPQRIVLYEYLTCFTTKLSGGFVGRIRS